MSGLVSIFRLLLPVVILIPAVCISTNCPTVQTSRINSVCRIISDVSVEVTIGVEPGRVFADEAADVRVVVSGAIVTQASFGAALQTSLLFGFRILHERVQGALPT